MKANNYQNYSNEELIIFLDMIEEENYTHIFDEELEPLFNKMCDAYISRSKEKQSQSIREWLRDQKEIILTEQIRRMRL